MASVWKLQCPEHRIELITERTISFNKDGIVSKYPMFFCEKCSKYYIHTDAVSMNRSLDYGGYQVINVENEPYETKEEERVCKYLFSDLIPDEVRKSSDEVMMYMGSFEECQLNYKKNFPYTLLHYGFLFRRFDAVNKIMCSLSEDEWGRALHFKGEKGYEWITPLVCAKWNLNYLYSYDDKYDTHIFEAIERYLPEVEHIDEVIEYTDVADTYGHNIFDIIWKRKQPLLDVIYYEKQEAASKQLMKNKVSIVMDEVGTGKTVSALYAIRDIIQEKKADHRTARVLVVCPYNKREDWQNDIRRQLGRYAHIVEQGDNGGMYSGSLKKVFFKEAEEIIMIAGQKKGSDSEGPHTALKGSVEVYSESENWDLAVIDECHISFGNYGGIRAERAMLLTATPIVVNAKGKRTFEDYKELLHNITEAPVGGKNIDPINNSIPSEDDIYVNWFREDMGKIAAERKIQFVSCKRHPDRDDIFYRIKAEAGTLAALIYDQDDNYLFETAVNKYGYTDIKEIKKNGKLEKLVELLKESKKSYIIFCEHQYVVQLIFDRLKAEFADEVVAEKFGKFENQYGLGNVQDGQLINTLMQALRSSKRVLFVTTGKTGGTGLNLGEFDGIIHYELPFTSIELEQRFGRVDRIDTIAASRSRDMIFMLNECKADENDMEINRMLYYCTTKIDITCQYMPVRNTVLYYPEFIKRNGAAIRESLLYFQKEYVLSEENEKKIKEIRRKRRIFENEIKKNQIWKFISKEGKTVRECVLKTLYAEKNDEIPDEYYEYLNEYIEFLRNTKPERNEYQRVYRQFMEAKRNASHWLGIIGLVELSDESGVFVGYETTEDGQEQAVIPDNDSRDDKKIGNISSVQKQIRTLIDLVDKSNFENAELKGFSSEGIFCYINNMIKRSSVQDYRNGADWK